MSFVDDELGGEAACSAHLFDTDEEPDDHRLAQLVRDLADAVVICDTDRRITFWNRAAEALFGWSAVQAAGKSLAIIVPDNVWPTDGAAVGSAPIRVQAKHADGRPMNIAVTLTPMRVPGQRVASGMAAIVRLADG